MYRMLIAVALGVVLAGLITAPTARAQDFNTTVREALRANEQLIQEIRSALDTSNLATLRARTQGSVATAERVLSLLQDAQRVAPDDASRSRAEGVLVHNRAALAALRQALQETTIDAARGRLEQARGEAEEALAELRPFAQALPQVAQAAPAPVVARAPVLLPPTGDPIGWQLAAAAFGALFVLAGRRLRRRATMSSA